MSILLLSLLAGILIGVGVIVIGREYVPEWRFRLGVMLIQGAGRDVLDVVPTAAPTATPVP